MSFPQPLTVGEGSRSRGPCIRGRYGLRGGWQTVNGLEMLSFVGAGRGDRLRLAFGENGKRPGRQRQTAGGRDPRSTR